MPRWIRYHYPDEDVLGYVEIDDDGAADRHCEVLGPDHRPVLAETRTELVRLRDHGSPADMAEYQRRYGHGSVLEGGLSKIELSDRVVEIPAAEFEQAWAPVRAALDAQP
jgi:hypothetical protein